MGSGTAQKMTANSDFSAQRRAARRGFARSVNTLIEICVFSFWRNRGVLSERALILGRKSTLAALRAASW